MCRGYLTRSIVAAIVLCGSLSVVPSHAQGRPIPDDGRSERAAPVDPARLHDRGSGLPSQLERDFAPPDPDRPWGPPRYLERRRYRPYGYRRYHGRRWYYYDDYTYRFGPRRWGDPYGDDLERAYRQGVSDGQHFERFEIQAERGLANYQDAMATGHAAFAMGDYPLAVKQFLLAATLNQGDPASRLCAAHAHIAVGAYGPAARLVRRAIELQPKLIYLPMDIRTAYGNRADFNKHLQALRRTAKADAENGDLWFVLGYVHYYSDNMAGAARALAKSAKLLPDDGVVARLADLAQTSAQRPGKASPKKKSQRRKHEL